MKDITTKLDIELLLQAFYEKAINDELIGHYFTDVIELQLEKHLPIIVGFWESILLNTQQYNGNMFSIHQHIHHLSPFKPLHFDRWVFLFQQTVSEMYKGNTSELAKQRAASIATIMKTKLIYHSSNSLNI
ncbi:MAG: group III truncated hemoglobin [Chitinophagaceae bacterium]